jgi:hypothetical protein
MHTKIYRVHPEYAKGQLMKKKVSRMPVDLALHSPNKSLKLSADIMPIDGHMFLISVAAPLMLMLYSELESESRMSLGMALQGQLGMLWLQGFIPHIVYTDLHCTFWLMMQDFTGIEIDPGGQGDYVPQVDATICRVKETYRKVQSGLPWTLLSVLVGALVGSSVSHLNACRTTALGGNVCPKVLFTGRPLEFKKEFRLAFGDYVEAYEGTTNRMMDRSMACIALSPANNSVGAWILWKLSKRSRIRRTNWVKMVTTPLIIDAMNAIARECAEQVEAPVRQLQELIVSQQSAAGRITEEEELEEQAEVPEGIQVEQGETEDTAELVPQPEQDESDDEVEEETEVNRVVIRSG